MLRRTPKHLSTKGAAFIGAFEGYRQFPYNDAVNNATIGYGHLLHYGPVTKADLARYPHGISRTDALKLLQKDAEHCAAYIREIRPAIQNQARFDALCSIAFNCGTGVLYPQSTLGACLRRPGREGTASAFLLYCHAGGHVLPGLLRRRQDERTLWLSGDYTVR